MKVTVSDINKLQRRIMGFVDLWAREKKTPVPLAEIRKKMKEEGIKVYTVEKAVHSLINKGYIRRAVAISNKTFFVQLRGLGSSKKYDTEI